MFNLEELINLGSQNPDIFVAGFVVGLLFMLAFMLWSSICDVVISLTRYIWQKVRALKIENDKKDPPKRFFSNLFQKKSNNEKNRKKHLKTGAFLVAEREGFEPSERY